MSEFRDPTRPAQPLDTEAEDEAVREDGLDPAPRDEAPAATAEVLDEDVEAAAVIDYEDQFLRARAELENVRKRARRDVALAETRGIARLARELLPSLDNLDRALAAAESQPENADHHLTDGIRLVQKELLGALERVGIKPDVPVGSLFDPHVHEAVAQLPADGRHASGTIVEVYSAGYRLGDDVLRPAKVVVAA